MNEAKLLSYILRYDFLASHNDAYHRYSSEDIKKMRYYAKEIKKKFLDL